LTDSTTTTLAASPTSEKYGNEAATTFSVTVRTGGGEPLPFTGETAVVSVAGSAICVAPLTPGGTGGTGSCSIGETALNPGKYQATATYVGDAELDSSRSAPIAFSVTEASTKTALVLSKKTVAFDNETAEVFTATVSPEYAGSMPTGTVTVTESTATVCVITLSAATGSCPLSADQLPAGSYELIGTYSGDGNFGGSASPRKALTVSS